MLPRLRIPIISFFAALVFGITTYLLSSTDLTPLFWAGYVLTALSIFVLQLSLLTSLFDLLSVHAPLGIALLILTLGLLIGIGIFLRWLFDSTILYWLVSTIFPVVCGGAYVVDVLQKS